MKIKSNKIILNNKLDKSKKVFKKVSFNNKINKEIENKIKNINKIYNNDNKAAKFFKINNLKTNKLKENKIKNIFDNLIEKEKKKDNEIILIKDLVKSWEEINIYFSKANYNILLYNYVKEYKKIKIHTIKSQIKLELLLKKNKTVKSFKLLCFKNQAIKNWYLLIVKDIKQKLRDKDYYYKYINKFVYAFFKALTFCLENSNFHLSTLVFQLQKQLILVLGLYIDSQMKKEKRDKLESAQEFKDRLDKIKLEKSIERKKVLIKIRNMIFESSIKENLIKIQDEEFNLLTDEMINNQGYCFKNNFRNYLTMFSLEEKLNKYLNTYIQTIHFKPPMFVKPKKWKIIKKTEFELYEGGYYNNLFLKINTDENKKIKFNKSYFDALNYLHDIPLQINTTYLNNILNTDILLILKEYELLDKSKLLHYKNKELSKLKICEINIINEFCSLLYYAKLFKNQKLYFPCTYDWRGRCYPMSYPLQYYTKDIWKGIFKFCNKDNNFKLSNKNLEFLKNNSGDIKLFEKLYKEEDRFYSLKNSYMYEAIYNAKHQAMIGLDASSSSFQIQGLLINDEEMLKYTNVFSNEKKEDIYQHVALNLFKDFDIKSLNNKFKSKNPIFNNILESLELWQRFNHCNTSENSENKSNPLFTTEKEFNEFIEKVKKDRKLIKQTVMRLGYNQQLDSRINEMYEYMKLNYLNNLINFNYSFNEFVFNLAYDIEKIFYKLFFKQKLLKEFFKKAINTIVKRKEDNFIIFDTRSNTHRVYQKYIKGENINIYIRSRRSKKVFHFRWNLPDIDNKIDINKSMLATLPNYIQYLDSCIMVRVLLLTKQNDIEIKTIHDNFITHWEHLDKLNDIYVVAMQKVLLTKPHPLYYFLMINNLVENKILLEMYNQLTNHGLDYDLLMGLLKNKDFMNKRIEDLYFEDGIEDTNLDKMYKIIKEKMKLNKYILTF